MKLKSLAFATLTATMLSTGATAAIYNPTSPVTFNTTALDTIFTDLTNNVNVIDETNDQSGAAVWTPADLSASQSYLISLSNSAGTLGIYSYATGEEVDLTFGANDQATLTFNSGALVINNGFSTGSVDNSFGTLFGFYYNNGTSTTYTEDSKNGNVAGALSYLLSNGTMTTEGPAAGNDDWLIAFEDINSNSDYDFADAVFMMKDLEVSAPATLALMGLGLLGLSVRRNKKQKA